MKTIEQTIILIETHMKEHKETVEAIYTDLQALKKDKNIETAQKYMLLKDRILFHKGCLLVLQDLLNDINK